jgi:uncharacterized membrane protein
MGRADILNPKRLKSALVWGSLFAIVLITAMLIGVFWPKYESQFIEFGLLGKDKMAEGYYPNNNHTIGLNLSVNWNLYVRNHMKNGQTLVVRVKLLNSTMEMPSDKENKPSPSATLTEIPLSLSVEEIAIIPFSWSFHEVFQQEGLTIIESLTVNNQMLSVDILDSNSSFRMVFELWVYDRSLQEYRFGWNIGEELFSTSLYMDFGIG